MKQKSKKHFLKKEAVKKSLEWNPDNVIQGIKGYIDNLMAIDLNVNSKKSMMVSYMANYYRGLEGVVKSEFAKTEPKSRLFLSEHEGEWVRCAGVAIAIRKFKNHAKLLIAMPHVTGKVLGNPKGKYSIQEFPKERQVDSHIWIDLQDLDRGNERNLSVILFGDVVDFVAKVKSYKGNGSNNIKKKTFKYGLTEVFLIRNGISNFDGVVYSGSFALRQFNKPSLGLITYSNKDKQYVPLWDSAASNIPNGVKKNRDAIKVATEKTGVASFIFGIFQGRLYQVDEVFRKKVDDYNNKYPEQAIKFSQVSEGGRNEEAE